MKNKVNSNFAIEKAFELAKIALEQGQIPYEPTDAVTSAKNVASYIDTLIDEFSDGEEY